MKAFGLFQLKNTTESQPTITQRNIYLKEKMYVEKRYRKKHAIKDYQNYLGVNALALSKPPVSSTYRKRISSFKFPRPSQVPKPISTPKLVKSKTEVFLPIKSKPFRAKPRKHVESPKVSSRIGVPVTVPYSVSVNGDFEPLPCIDFAFLIPKKPKIEVKVNFKLIQEEL